MKCFILNRFLIQNGYLGRIGFLWPKTLNCAATHMIWYKSSPTWSVSVINWFRMGPRYRNSKGPIYWVRGIEWVRKNRCPVSYNVNIINLVINTFISTSTKNYIKQMSTYYFMVTSSLNMPKSNRITLIDKKMCQFWR